MNEPLYTVEEAAKKLETNISGIYQLAINGELRMGVNARGWYGIWLPTYPDTGKLIGSKHDLTNVDKEGRRYFEHLSLEGEFIELAEFYIHHFWYVEFSQLYRLLTSRDTERATELFEPTKEWHSMALEFNPPQVTQSGVFAAFRNYKNQEQDLTICASDLLIPASELTQNTRSRKVQRQREKLLEALISECGREHLVSLGRKGLWEKLKQRDRRLFAASSLSTMAKFYERQQLIAFR